MATAASRLAVESGAADLGEWQMPRKTLLAVVLAAGCLQAVDDFGAAKSGQPALGLPGLFPLDAGAEAPANPSLALAGDAGAAPTLDCLAGVAPSRPEIFGSITGSAVVGPCPGSACVDFVDMDAQCGFGLQVHGVRTAVQLSTADCDALKRWFTSDVLLAGLRSPCGDGTGNESLEVGLTDPQLSSGKKFAGCTEEPFPSHRACLRAVRARYFPGL
jgi:hypothetical protein